MAVEAAEKIYMTTKSGMKFSVSFSQEPPDYKRLAKFFLLLSEKPEKAGMSSCRTPAPAKNKIQTKEGEKNK